MVESTPSQPSARLPHPSRRRDKPQLSCSLCRRRKLKCDRAYPCGTCVRRGLSLSCTYPHPHQHVTTAPAQVQPPERASQAQPKNIQDRIAQLESLVVSLMKESNDAKPSEDAAKDAPKTPAKGSDKPAATERVEISMLSDNFGRISLENKEIAYVEANHWTSILDGIAELKDSFEDQEPPPLDVPEFSGPELFFGGYRSATKQEILMALPPRAIADRLISHCLKAGDAGIMIIHSYTFIKEYEAFWESPHETPIMWIGLLFSLICIGTAHAKFDPSNNIYGQPGVDLEFLVGKYREKIIQCLVLGRYTTSVPYTLETLLFYFHMELIRSEDSQTGVWILLGVIIRLALRMGLHRDPSHFPQTQITPFRGELRRRLWALIMELDIFASAQIGLPRMLKDSYADTLEPRNLLDEDLDENMLELPPARPDTTPSATQFFNSKNRIVFLYGSVLDLTTSTTLVTLADIKTLDQRLDKEFNNIPAWLHMRSMAKSIMDDPELISRRAYVGLSYHKTKCVLHRAYLLKKQSDAYYQYSRPKCISSALFILDFQCVLDEETRPGGRLHKGRWIILSALKTVFLVAVTVLCLELDHELPLGYEKRLAEAEQRKRIIKALTSSYWIWVPSCKSSREAQKAAAAIRVVLGKVQRQDLPPADPDEPGMMAPAYGTQSNMNVFRPHLGFPHPVVDTMSDMSDASGESVSLLSEMLDFDIETLDSFSEIEKPAFSLDSWESGYSTGSINSMIEDLRTTSGIF